MVEILDKSNAPLQEIYDTVCSVVPAMADEDMYFLDFEGLGNLNDRMTLFDSGKYRISFRYMEKELFYTWVYFLEGGMSLVKPFEI